jgi:hypothetical protein
MVCYRVFRYKEELSKKHLSGPVLRIMTPDWGLGMGLE